MGYGNVGYTAHYKRTSGKIRAAGIDHGSSIRDILAMRNIVALRLIFEY
jgi:hypothetical protein